MKTRAGFRSPLWGVVLAGGSGTRLRPYIADRFGIDTPKQYVAFTGKRSMLEHTIDRLESIIPPNRVLTVVDASHRRDSIEQISRRGSGGVLRQPRNLDTAPGVLLALTAVLQRDPRARVVLFPSDHFILEEKRFMSFVSAAGVFVERHPEKTVLLGIEPEGPETEYGYIQPGAELDATDGAHLRAVERFHEKPNRERAEAYCENGYLWNTFVIVARADALYARIAGRLPELGASFDRIRRHWRGIYREFVLAREYASLEPSNLSRDVFSKMPEGIAVVPVWGVHWSDWGSGPRVERTLKELVTSRYSKEQRGGRVTMGPRHRASLAG
jgi:mannose-1-phosphate guanylyltransferase